MAGRVRVEGRTIDKPGIQVKGDESIVIKGGRPFVSRGGIKLEHALSEFGIPADDLVVLDIGASTGGFTHCLLLRGARRVYAVDVGRGQLDYRLRVDPRVVVMEGLNARYPFSLPERAGLVVVDVSFISLEKVVPRGLEHLEYNGWLIALVKPQFEVSKSEVGRGGIVREPEARRRAIRKVADCLAEVGLKGQGLLESPIPGGDGNLEYLLWLRKDRAMADLEVDQ